VRPVAKSRLIPALSLALLLAGSLMVVLGLAGSAAADAPQTTSPDAAAASDPGPAAPAPDTTAPAPATATASAAPQPQAAPVAVRASRAKASAIRSVSIIDFAYDPASITVHTGDTVIWTNNGTAEEGHNVTGDGLDSGTLAPGAAYSFKFTTAGTFAYVCTIHPDMKASVQVLGRSKAAPAGSGGNGSSGGGSNRSGGGGSGSSGGSSGSASPAAAGPAGTSSASSGSSDPGSSSGSLPQTGSDSLSLTEIGLMLFALGLVMRLPRRSS
jgi:LPXTG-motif cell wall-anchored protein